MPFSQIILLKIEWVLLLYQQRSQQSLLSYRFSIFSPQLDLKLSKISFMTYDFRLDPQLPNEVSVGLKPIPLGHS